MMTTRAFRDQNKMTSVQNELEHLITQLVKCEKSPLKTELLTSSKQMKKKVDKETKDAWKSYMGKDRVLIDCPVCSGSGHTLKYVGICCDDEVNASPYIKVTCQRCEGDGKVLAKKAKV